MTDTIGTLQGIVILLCVGWLAFFMTGALFKWAWHEGELEAQVEYYEREGITPQSFAKYKHDAEHYERLYYKCKEKNYE